MFAGPVEVSSEVEGIGLCETRRVCSSQAVELVRKLRKREQVVSLR